MEQNRVSRYHNKAYEVYDLMEIRRKRLQENIRNKEQEGGMDWREYQLKMDLESGVDVLADIEQAKRRYHKKDIVELIDHSVIETSEKGRIKWRLVSNHEATYIKILRMAYKLMNDEVLSVNAFRQFNPGFNAMYLNMTNKGINYKNFVNTNWSLIIHI